MASHLFSPLAPATFSWESGTALGCPPAAWWCSITVLLQFQLTAGLWVWRSPCPPRVASGKCSACSEWLLLCSQHAELRSSLPFWNFSVRDEDPWCQQASYFFSDFPKGRRVETPLMSYSPPALLLPPPEVGVVGWLMRRKWRAHWLHIFKTLYLLCESVWQSV